MRQWRMLCNRWRCFFKPICWIWPLLKDFEHPTSSANNVTMGKIHIKSVINKTRPSDYLGKTAYKSYPILPTNQTSMRLLENESNVRHHYYGNWWNCWWHWKSALPWSDQATEGRFGCWTNSGDTFNPHPYLSAANTNSKTNSSTLKGISKQVSEPTSGLPDHPLSKNWEKLALFWCWKRSSHTKLIDAHTIYDVPISNIKENWIELY